MPSASLIQDATARVRVMSKKITDLEGQINQTRGRQKVRLESELQTAKNGLRNFATDFAETLNVVDIKCAMSASVDGTASAMEHLGGLRVRSFPNFFRFVDPTRQGIPVFRLNATIPESVSKHLDEVLHDEPVSCTRMGDGNLSISADAGSLVRWVAAVTPAFYNADELDVLEAMIDSLRPEGP